MFHTLFVHLQSFFGVVAIGCLVPWLSLVWQAVQVIVLYWFGNFMFCIVYVLKIEPRFVLIWICSFID